MGSPRGAVLSPRSSSSVWAKRPTQQPGGLASPASPDRAAEPYPCRDPALGRPVPAEAGAAWPPHSPALSPQPQGTWSPHLWVLTTHCPAVTCPSILPVCVFGEKAPCQEPGGCDAGSCPGPGPAFCLPAKGPSISSGCCFDASQKAPSERPHGQRQRCLEGAAGRKARRVSAEPRRGRPRRGQGAPPRCTSGGRPLALVTLTALLPI